MTWNLESVQSLVKSVGVKMQTSLPSHIASVQDVSAFACHLIYTSQLDIDESDILDCFQFSSIDSGKRFKRGFPGIVLTALVAKIFDPNYQPHTNYYDCHPRPLFEKGIAPILRDSFGAPMGKSDPLNVAKNASRIDEEWVKGKRPESAARASSRLISWVSTSPKAELEQLLDLIIATYLALAKLYHVDTDITPTIGYGSVELHNLLEQLMSFAPASGNTAQAVVGAVLEAQHQLFHSPNILEGIGESVFATNTTAGKAGDFVEIFASQTHVYEVTTKVVDTQRLNESADAIKRYLERLKDIPIMMHSSLSATENKRLGMKVGVDAYLPKLKPKEFEETVTRILGDDPELQREAS